MKSSSLASRQVNCRLNPFGDSLERCLSAYSAAAAAAGVSLLALSPSAEARVIYTPADIPILERQALLLDLNHDSVTDFVVSNFEGSYILGLRASASNPANAVWGRGVFKERRWVTYSRGCSSGFAAALPHGFKIRPDNLFLQKSACWVMVWRGGGSFSALTSTFGQWMYTQHRYLGLKFMIGGQVHYGWARFSVVLGKNGIQATLTGYAYETVPNEAIVAGKTEGSDVVTLQPVTLGRLAQGAMGVSTWRQKK